MKEDLQSPMGFNKPTYLMADVRPVKSAKTYKAPNCSENDLGYYSRNVARLL